MKNQLPTAPTCTDKTCATGTCGGLGLCPGIALFIALAVGKGIAALTSLTWLGWAVGILLGLVLITGAWRWLPTRSSDKASEPRFPSPK